MQFNIIYKAQIESTNKYAQQLIEDGTLHEGDVILASFQEKGRGHSTNHWESEPNSNLLTSIILEPYMISASQQFILTQLISVAIVDLVKKYVDNQNVTIKWPNDIYINNKKVCGILIQNFIKGNKIEYSIAGIGINVNQKKFMSDAPNPVSIIHYTNKPVELSVFLDKLLENIGINYEAIKSKSYFPKLKSSYLDRLFQYNLWAAYSANGKTFQGKIVDVDEYGRLKVMLKNNTIKLFMFKEIAFVR